MIKLINTRPDILHAVSVISKYIEKPNKSYLMAVMRILKYVKGIKNFGVKYEFENEAMFLPWEARLYHDLLRRKKWLYYLHVKPGIFPSQVQHMKLFG